MPTVEKRIERECPHYPNEFAHVAAHLPCVSGATRRLEQGGNYSQRELHDLCTIAQHTVEFIDGLPGGQMFADQREMFVVFLEMIEQPTLAA